eukprot:1309946-Rhodomonas_salina.1
MGPAKLSSKVDPHPHSSCQPQAPTSKRNAESPRLEVIISPDAAKSNARQRNLRKQLHGSSTSMPQECVLLHSV